MNIDNYELSWGAGLEKQLSLKDFQWSIKQLFKVWNRILPFLSFSPKQFRAEELHFVENSCHDNPTLDVTNDNQPEMREKKPTTNGLAAGGIGGGAESSRWKVIGWVFNSLDVSMSSTKVVWVHVSSSGVCESSSNGGGRGAGHASLMEEEETWRSLTDGWEVEPMRRMELGLSGRSHWRRHGFTLFESVLKSVAEVMSETWRSPDEAPECPFTQVLCVVLSLSLQFLYRLRWASDVLH